MSTIRRLALWVSCVAQLTVVLDISVVNIALPSIQSDLAMGREGASWVALAYSLGFAGLLLVGARLADVVGTVRVLMWGMTSFTVASVVGGLATAGGALIAARAVQGLSAAVLSPATFTLLTTTHPEGRSRTRAVAIWTAVSLAGGGIGNITSGVLTDLISWRAVLLINLPVGAAVAFGALTLRKHIPAVHRRGQLSLSGALLATGGFSSATYAISVVGAGQTLASAVAGASSVLLFVLLIVQQRRSAERLVPAGLLKDRLIVLGNLATALTAVCFQVGLWFFLTYRMQGQLGYSAVQAGVAFLPLTVTMIVVNLWATPRLMQLLSSRLLVGIGAVVAGFGVLWLATLGDGPFLLTILVPSAMIGIGGGLMNTPLATIVTTGVGPGQAGAASGLMNTGKQFGGAVGLATATTAATAAGTDRAAFLMMAAALAGVALLAARLPQQVDRFVEGE